MKRKFVRAVLFLAAGLGVANVGTSVQALQPADSGSRNGVSTNAPHYRIVRFTGSMNLWLASRAEDEPFSPRGSIKLNEGSDPFMDPATPATYESTVVSAAGGKFTDNGVLHFSKGDVQFTGVFPTENATTPVNGVLHTVAVQKVTGGTGAFDGASGYVLTNSTIGEGGVHGTLDGLLFVRQ